MKVLVATEKPFAKVAVDGIRKEIEAAGYELALLEKYTDKAQLLDAVKDANAIIIRSDIIDAEVLDAAKELKIVVRAGAGYDNVDLAAATAHNVCVMNTPGQNSNAVAELALGMMVYAVRNFYNGTSGTELMGKKLGIHAYGNVGRNAEIDRNKLFVGTAAKEDRSRMNICFVMAPEYKDLEADFMKFATEKGMVGIKGHRSVGGFRASCYNALPKESVQALIDCMQEFEKLH